MNCRHPECPELCGLRDTVLAIARGAEGRAEARWQALRECCESGEIYDVELSHGATGSQKCICCNNMVSRFLAKMDELEREQPGGLGAENRS